VGEGLGPAGERLVRGDRGTLFSLGEYLEEQFGAAAVEVHVSQLIPAEQVDAAVAGDDLGQLPVVGGDHLSPSRSRRSQRLAGAAR